MKQVFIVIFFTFFSLNTFAQNVLERKISGGLFFSGILFNNLLSITQVEGNFNEGYDYNYTIPSVGISPFIEYHINKHSFGLSYQSVFYDNEFSYIYIDSTDGNHNTIYNEGFRDYTEYKFNNFFAFYRYSFIIANFQPSVKIGVGYHNVNLKGYSSYIYINDSIRVSFSEEFYDQIVLGYWSVKPEIEGAFRFSKHVSVFGSLAYDFSLTKEEEYTYYYDSYLIEKGYVTEISRRFNSPNYFEFNLGMAFSF